MRSWFIFGASFTAALGASLWLANRTRVALETQGGALAATLAREGSSYEAHLLAQGDRMQTELTALARPIAERAAAAQVTTTLTSYGVTPEFLGRLQAAARRLG